MNAIGITTKPLYSTIYTYSWSILDTLGQVIFMDIITVVSKLNLREFFIIPQLDY